LVKALAYVGAFSFLGFIESKVDADWDIYSAYRVVCLSMVRLG
jgi:hypothetical protein